MIDVRRLAAWVRFEAVRRVRWVPFRAVAVLYVGFVAVAQRRDPPALVADAGLVLLGWTLYAGFGEDRELGFDDLAVPNLATPAEYVAGKLAALAFALAVTGAGVAGAVLVASGGSRAEATWHGVTFGLFGAYLLPLVLWIESATESRLSGLAAVCASAVLFGVLAWVLGAERAVQLAGLERMPPRIETLGPLALRALLIAPIPSLAAVAVVGRRLRVRPAVGT